MTLSSFGGVAYVSKKVCPLYVSGAYTGTVTLDNVTFVNFNRTAVTLGGGTAVVKDCTITGDLTARNAAGAYFQNGIGVYNATVTVSGTTISGIGAYDPEWEDSNVAECIQLFGAGSVTIQSGSYTGQYSAIVTEGASGTIAVEGGTFVGPLALEEGTDGMITSTDNTLPIEEDFEWTGPVDGVYTLEVVEPTYDGVYTVANPDEVVPVNGVISIPAGTTQIMFAGKDVTAAFETIAETDTTATFKKPNATSITVGGETVTLNVDVVLGLAYGIAQGATLEALEAAGTPTLQNINTEEQKTAFLTCGKPSTGAGFFKVFVDFKDRTPANP